jgi:hypothetical protein
MANPNDVIWPPGSGSWSGCSGFSGVSGFSGDSGTEGEFGPFGISGLDLVGDSGASGYSGESGTSGFSGESGFSGLCGFIGFSGESGFSGFRPSGLYGHSGTSGTSGISGTSGSSGYSAQVSGFSGTSGVSGFGAITAPLVLSAGFSGTVDSDTKTFAFSAFAGDISAGLVGRKVLINFWMSTTDLGSGDVDIVFPDVIVANKGTLVYPPFGTIPSLRPGWILTDATGAFEVDVTLAGAPGVRYFMASVFNDVQSTAHEFT